MVTLRLLLVATALVFPAVAGSAVAEPPPEEECRRRGGYYVSMVGCVSLSCPPKCVEPLALVVEQEPHAVVTWSASAS